jgi:hypothetical protein
MIGQLVTKNLLVGLQNGKTNRLAVCYHKEIKNRQSKEFIMTLYSIVGMLVIYVILVIGVYWLVTNITFLPRKERDNVKDNTDE